MNGQHLSKRLQTVADLVEIGDTVVDIGTDHAYLPINLVVSRISEKVIAGEAAQGPFENALSEIQKSGLSDFIDLRFGNGLEILHPEDQINVIIMAGMGAELIINILEKYIINNTMILQANSEVPLLREYLSTHNQKIVDEKIVFDEHYYQIIKTEPGQQKLTNNQIKFGPILLTEKSDIFRNYWSNELSRLEEIEKRLKASYQDHTPRFLQIQAEIIQITTIINV